MSPPHAARASAALPSEERRPGSARPGPYLGVVRVPLLPDAQSTHALPGLVRLPRRRAGAARVRHSAFADGAQNISGTAQQLSLLAKHAQQILQGRSDLPRGSHLTVTGEV